MVESGAVTLSDKTLNDMTDDYAKRGAKMVEELVPPNEALEVYAKGRAFYKAMIPFCQNWVEDTLADIEPPPAAAFPPASLRRRGPLPCLS